MTMRVHWRIPLIVAAAVPLFLIGPGTGPLLPAERSTPVRLAVSAPDTTAAEYARRYRISPALATLILERATEVGVAPALVFGLIATESGFNPRAVGQKGAVGLMQIKTSTARIYDRHVTRERLLRPDVNLRLGLRHLKQEVAYFGNDWTLGLMAYNMGRTRLNRVLQSGRVPRNRYAAKVLAHCDELCS